MIMVRTSVSHCVEGQSQKTITLRKLSLQMECTRKQRYVSFTDFRQM